MPTKYVDLAGHAVYTHYVGRTTLPSVIPDFSRGRAIVLLHAAGSNGHAWHNQLAHLGKAHSPIAFDFPGHGRSDGVEGPATVRECADLLAALLDAFKIDAAVIAGRSMGGAVAMDFALRYPQRVQALILVATAAKFNIPAETVAQLKAVTQGRAPQAFLTTGFAPKTIKENFGVVREYWMEQIKTDPRVRYTDILACSEVDLRDQIGKIAKPTLIIVGAEDQVTTPADAEFLRDRIAGARLEIIADAAHNLTTEKPAEVNAAIDKFLASLN